MQKNAQRWMIGAAVAGVILMGLAGWWVGGLGAKSPGGPVAAERAPEVAGKGLTLAAVQGTQADPAQAVSDGKVMLNAEPVQPGQFTVQFAIPGGNGAPVQSFKSGLVRVPTEGGTNGQFGQPMTVINGPLPQGAPTITVTNPHVVLRANGQTIGDTLQLQGTQGQPREVTLTGGNGTAATVTVTIDANGKITGINGQPALPAPPNPGNARTDPLIESTLREATGFGSAIRFVQKARSGLGRASTSLVG